MYQSTQSGELSRDTLDVINITAQKLRMGDPITDEELSIYIYVLEFMVPVLRTLGERFHHTWLDLYQQLNDCKAFQDARERK
jgi:hypothetical protein